MKRSTRMMLMSSGNNRRYNDGRSYDNYDVMISFVTAVAGSITTMAAMRRALR